MRSVQNISVIKTLNFIVIQRIIWPSEKHTIVGGHMKCSAAGVFFSAMSSVLTCVSVLILFNRYSCLFSFLPLFPHASSPALLQLKCLHPRCCHPSSYQMKTSAPLWTKRLFHQTVYLLIQAPSYGSSWAFPTLWWERKTNCWKLGITGFIFIAPRGFGHVQLSNLSVSYNQCCCMRARLIF